jgi:DNA-binding LytR/AlgR family response regulator
VVVVSAPSGGPDGAGEGADDIVAVDSPRGNARRLIQRRTVLYGKAIGDYVRLVTDEGRFLVRGKISDMERRWAPRGFVRTHRSYVINAGRAVELRRNGNGTASVQLDDGRQVPVSRRQLRAVKDALNA